MLNEADNFIDIIRTGLPYCLLCALPFLIFCSPAMGHEFPVHRMAQFDVNGVNMGCRASDISLEAKSLNTWSTSRHCVLARFLDMSVADFHKIRQKAGGLIALLPQNISSLSKDIKEEMRVLELAMLAQSIPIPVYFAPHNSPLEEIINDITYKGIQNNNYSENAFEQLILSISANGYQVTVAGGNNIANKNSKISVMQGELIPNQFNMRLSESATENNLPTIIITANLKTFGIFNDYPLNTDTAIFMTLVEIFSKLYSVRNMTPKYRIVFLLSDSGVLLNFQGTKKWLDENTVSQNVEFVLCLDTVSSAMAHDSLDVLYMHVSKPPKEKSSISNFFKLLKTSAQDHAENLTIEGIHKKINLADSQLSWEHERFSIKRYPAFSLSSVKNPKSPVRTSIFKEDDPQVLQKMVTSIKTIAEALASYIFKLDDTVGIFNGHLDLNKEMMLSYLGTRSTLQNYDIKDGFEKYLKNVKVIIDKPDVREPEFMLYDGHEAKLSVYKVKPAVFDLILTLLISVYLSFVYFSLQYFPRFYDLLAKFTKPKACSQINGSFNDRLRMKLN